MSSSVARAVSLRPASSASRSLPPCTCTCSHPRRAFSGSGAPLVRASAARLSHDNPLGLPRNDAPPTMPRMQRGLPQKRKLPGVKKVVVVSSGKGGVGKSTVSVNLALGLAGLPSRPSVGILDLDIFGPSIPKLMALEKMGEPFLTEQNRLIPLKSHGIPCMSMGFLLPPAPPSADGTEGSNADTPVVWRGMMVMKAVQQLLFDVDWRAGTSSGGELDVLVVDMPPGTGDVALSLGQLVSVDGAVVVSTPQSVALLDTRKGIALFRKLGIPIFGSVLNMSHFLCPGSATAHYVFGPPATFRETSANLGLDVLAEVPLEADVSSRGDRGWPAVMPDGEAEPAAASADAVGAGARDAFRSLAAQVWAKLSR